MFQLAVIKLKRVHASRVQSCFKNYGVPEDKSAAVSFESVLGRAVLVTG